jgi:Gp157 protein
MPTLPQILQEEKTINQQLEQFLDSLDELNLTPEAEQAELDRFFNQLFANDQQKKDKLNSTSWFITKLVADAEYNRSHARRLQQRAKVLDNRAKALKQLIMYQVDKEGGKVKLADFDLSVRATDYSVVIDEDFTGEVPHEYCKPLELRDTVKLDAIKRDLKLGVDIPFAKLGEKGKALYGLTPPKDKGDE